MKWFISRDETELAPKIFIIYIVTVFMSSLLIIAAMNGKMDLILFSSIAVVLAAVKALPLIRFLLSDMRKNHLYLIFPVALVAAIVAIKMYGGGWAYLFVMLITVLLVVFVAKNLANNLAERRIKL